MLSTQCHVAAVKIWDHFLLIILAAIDNKEIFIFSNCRYLEWRMGLSDKIFKGEHLSQ
jgi:hypothetical protein